MKVSFAKYDKKGLLWNVPVSKEEEEVSEAVGRKEKFLKNMTSVRCYKEVVQGVPNKLKDEHWASKNPRNMVRPDVVWNKRQPNKMNLKGMFWRLTAEIFCLTNMEKVKQKLGVLVDEANNEIFRDEESSAAPPDRKKDDEVQQMEGRDEMSGIFLEEDLLCTMLHKDQDDLTP